MFKKLLPQKNEFFDYFEQHGEITVAASRTFLEMAAGKSDRETGVDQIKQWEHQADEITHRCIESLHRTFVTPLDRNDIHNLIQRLDDVVDHLDGAAKRFVLYDLETSRQEVHDMAAVLVNACTAIGKALHHLRDAHSAKETIAICIQIHQHESEGDQALRTALVRLFREETSPIMIIKWKEVYEKLEQAIDSCDDVADIIEGIVIEAS